ncbi:hypothetical protein HDU98_001449, partial [Podochytrium sp. JEL0797]
MQQSNLHHFFVRGQPVPSAPPVPPPLSKKRGRPAKEKPSAPANPLGRDGRGGNRKSAAFKTANQPKPTAGPLKSAANHLLKDSQHSAEVEDSLPVAESSAKRAKPVSAPTSDSRTDASLVTPPPPSSGSSNSSLASLMRAELTRLGASAAIADEVVSTVDFNNCPLPMEGNGDGEGDFDDGIDPDEMDGDPNLCNDSETDEEGGVGRERSGGARQRPTNRYIGPASMYVSRVTNELRKADKLGRGTSPRWKAIRERHVRIEAPSASCEIEKDVSKGLEPDPLHSTAPDIVVMALHESFPGFCLTCPECGNAGVKPKGWADAPRLIYDLDSYFVFFARGYRCDAMAHGMGPTKVHHILRENYTRTHTEKCLEYLNTVETIVQGQRAEAEGAKVPGYQPTLMKPFLIPQPFPELKKFPNFKSEEYAGKYPCAQFLSRVLIQYVRQLQPYCDAEVHRRAGQVNAGDHSFKITKHIATFDGVRIAEGVYTDFNEYSEITLQQVTQTSTMDELRESFMQDVRTRESLGTPSVKLRYSDRCCQDASVYDDVYKLNRGMMTLLPLPIPEPCATSVKTTNDSAALVAILRPIMDHLDHSSEPELVLGLDSEWEYPKRGKLNVVQVAAKIPTGGAFLLMILASHFNAYYSDYLFVIQLGSELREFPPVLKRLLEHPRVKVAGSYIHNEVNHLKDDWGVVIPVQRSVALSRLAKEKAAVSDARKGLDYLCRLVLQFSCPKMGTDRNSEWSKPLTKSQVTYAARDAWASLLVYLELVKGSSVGFFGMALEDLCPADYFSDDPAPCRAVAHSIASADQEMADAGLSSTPSPVSSLPEGSLHARILLDGFHGMVRITEHVPFSHVYRYAFVCALRDAIYVENAEDVKEVKAVCEQRGPTLEQLLAEKVDWVRSRIRRLIPCPDELVCRMKAVLLEFSKSKYNNSAGEPLLSEKARAEFKSLLKHAEKGCLSDPPGMSMYYPVRKDREGLTVYRCIRGTNRLESYHQKLEMLFDSWCASPELAACGLTIIRHWTNIAASERNRPGFPSVGHCDHYYIDRIQETWTSLAGEKLMPWWPTRAIELQGTLEFGFVPTRPFDEQDLVSEELVKSYPRRYAFLARQTRQNVPFLPIHTRNEIDLFHETAFRYLGGDGGRISSASKFDSKGMAADWNVGTLKGKHGVIPSVERRVFKKMDYHLDSMFK